MAIAVNYREQYARYGRYFKTIIDKYSKKPAVRTSVELLLTLFTISFFAVFALRPTAVTIARLVSDIRTQRDIEGRLTEKVDSLRKAQAVLSAEQARIVLLDQALPRGPHPDQLVQQIEGLSQTYGVGLESLSVGKTLILGKTDKKKAEKFGTFEVSFLVRGDYGGTISFLEELEALRRVVNLNSVSYGPSTKQGESGVIILTVGAQIPYYPEERKK